MQKFKIKIRKQTPKHGGTKKHKDKKKEMKKQGNFPENKLS